MQLLLGLLKGEVMNKYLYDGIATTCFVAFLVASFGGYPGLVWTLLGLFVALMVCRSDISK